MVGNRCFDQRVPEETNRNIVHHNGDINLTYSQIVRAYLLKKGFLADQKIVTGSPMKEVLLVNKESIKHSKTLEILKQDKNRYFLVSSHREENVDNLKKLEKFLISLNYIAENCNLPIIFSTHQRTKNKLKLLNYKINYLIRFFKQLSFTDYIKLQINLKSTLNDSETISKESPIFSFKALNLREKNFKRSEAMEESTVIMIQYNISDICNDLRILENTIQPKIFYNYNEENFIDKPLKTLISYINFMNQNSWKLYD